MTTIQTPSGSEVVYDCWVTYRRGPHKMAVDAVNGDVSGQTTFETKRAAIESLQAEGWELPTDFNPETDYKEDGKTVVLTCR